MEWISKEAARVLLQLRQGYLSIPVYRVVYLLVQRLGEFSYSTDFILSRKVIALFYSAPEILGLYLHTFSYGECPFCLIKGGQRNPMSFKELPGAAAAVAAV